MKTRSARSAVSKAKTSTGLKPRSAVSKAKTMTHTTVWKATEIDPKTRGLYITKRQRKPRTYKNTNPTTVWKATVRNPTGFLRTTKKTTGEPKGMFKFRELPPNFMTLLAGKLGENNVASVVQADPRLARTIQPRLNELKPKPKIYSRENLDKIRSYELRLSRLIPRRNHPTNPAFFNLVNRYYANFPNSNSNLNLLQQYVNTHGRSAPFRGSGHYLHTANLVRPGRVRTRIRVQQPKTNLRTAQLHWVKMPTYINWTNIKGPNKGRVHWLAHSENGKTQYKFFPYQTRKGTLRIKKNGNIRHHRKARNSYIFPTGM